MKQHLSRRSLLTALQGGVAAACLVSGLAAAPRPARADDLSTDGLLAINDDDNAVIDALTAGMWNAPQLVAQANLANALDWGHHVNSVPPLRTYGVDFAAPGPLGLKITDPNFQTYSYQMALLFACLDAAAARQDVRDFVNIAAFTTALKSNAEVPSAQLFSELVYQKLLQLSRPKNHPAAPLLTDYPRSWGDRLATTLQDQHYITGVLNLKDQALARRNLSLQLYKLRLLYPYAVTAVTQTWKTGDLGKTVFALAADDPWPPNYYDMMVRTAQTPLKPLVNGLLATHTTGNHQECVPVPGLFGGEESCAKVTDDYYGAPFVDFLRRESCASKLARSTWSADQLAEACGCPRAAYDEQGNRICL